MNKEWSKNFVQQDTNTIYHPEREREEKTDYTLQEKKLDKNSLILHNAWDVLSEYNKAISAEKNRWSKKDKNIVRRRHIMTNSLDKQKNSEVRRHGNGF